MADLSLAQSLAQATINMNRAWVLFSGALVFFMQAGFLCLECGMVREKNILVVAMKNLIDWIMASLGFFFIGFALMFGLEVFQPGLFGSFPINISDPGATPLGPIFFLFQLAFAGTAATIVSGATSERCGFAAYLTLSFLVSVLIYPVFGHWVWGNAFFSSNTPWLAQLGFIDFAGSSVVHLLGALVSTVAIVMMGPRLGRYDEDGNIRPFKSWNLSISALGCAILWLGWWGFNGGSTLEINDKVGSIILNTNLAAASAGLAAFAHSFYIQKKADINEKFLGGIITGLVSITACCSVVDTLGAILVGLTAGVIHNHAYDLVLKKWRLDDPVGAIPVHGFGGIWGLLCVAFFGLPQLTGHSLLNQLGIQLIGILACAVWTVPVSYIVLYFIKQTVGLRVSPEEEYAGINMHGEVLSAEIEEEEFDEATLIALMSGEVPSEAKENFTC